MKYKHFETESGKTIKTAQFNGYNIAEKLLEGLIFRVDIKEDGTLKVYVRSEDKIYFDQFNTEKFLREAQDFAEKNDIFEDPISGEDCWPIFRDNNEKNLSEKQPIVMKTSNFDEVMDSEEEKKKPIIGKYKPKRKFINFITGLKGKIRILRDSALIKGEELSGMLEGVVFKITICDEGTIDFEELDTNQTTPEMIQRLIDDIDSKDVTGYTQKFVVSNLNFYYDDNNPCYLEVEHVKPINKLFEIFDESRSHKITETGMSILDELFKSKNDDKEELEVELDYEETSEKSDSIEKVESESEVNKMIRQNLEKMNLEKSQELKERIEKSEKEIKKLQIDIKESENKIKKELEELRVLNSRLEFLGSKDDPLGYDFFVSQENKTGIEPDQNLINVVEKISPILKLDSGVVIDMLTKGFYTIKIKKQSGDDKTNEQILKKIQNIDIMGKISMVEISEFEYRGDMTWHQLVDKMICMGFEQNPEFDKECGSNSYVLAK
jgi:hypothetical protein